MDAKLTINARNGAVVLLTIVGPKTLDLAINGVWSAKLKVAVRDGWVGLDSDAHIGVALGFDAEGSAAPDEAAFGWLEDILYDVLVDHNLDEENVQIVDVDATAYQIVKDDGTGADDFQEEIPAARKGWTIYRYHDEAAFAGLLDFPVDIDGEEYDTGDEDEDEDEVDEDEVDEDYEYEDEDDDAPENITLGFVHGEAGASEDEDAG